MRVLVTGASGLLGLIGTAFSRVSGGLLKVDLTKNAEVRQLFEEHRPQVVIHCAAERRPDVVAQHPDGALTLNVDATSQLARCCKEYHAFLVYISTDYVFDGTSPPYDVDATPNPLNLYGKLKLRGEEALRAVGGNAVTLRVPVLYGDVEYPEESAVNILQKNVDNPDKPVNMDHVAIRYPTNVVDVARVCRDIAVLGVDKQQTLPPILHFSASEPMTKYDMCVDRPLNSALSVTGLTQLGIDAGHVPFRAWWRKHLSV
ncbi:hypothetical protein THASP1DRAFT_35163 [Thamnocephalis sphaerospora]|uniref:RmlD-like substrate binding domain-containing protein n=1 Tax=Thamnocephalis sphaerospora TaxID=78915 RepID=A0A4P9XM04_9FUNG|nr:hypothetical protein THASP1DRAFT_35163 [Thamnocephalis sphaerospora]|eukprot:RKP06381.1 hypothetical protein THASP1DRAFT_35163 [Thamnocephalis sphaerospora]